MKLYGLALAAIPRKENKSIIDVTCTPIAVTDKKRTEFEILKKPRPFETTFDIRHPKEVVDCFVKTTNLIGKLVELQKASLAENGIKEYRPVALEIGQDGRKPINTNALYARLFGNKSFQPREHLPEKYKKAYAKLPQLLGQCTLVWGSFSTHAYKSRPLTTQTPLDIVLIELKKRLDKGDIDAQTELIDLATRIGRIFGEEVTSGNQSTFGYMAPPGYAQDKAMQEKYPMGSFFYWDPAFREAFNSGFRETANFPYFKHIKLYLDPPKPPFTDPCADLICDQFEIIYKQRYPEKVNDKPEWRQKLIEAAQRNARSSGERNPGK